MRRVTRVTPSVWFPADHVSTIRRCMGDGLFNRPVPDRLRGTYEAYGTQVRSENDQTYQPHANRSGLFSDVLGKPKNMNSYEKMDKIRAALEKARKETSESPLWADAFRAIRNNHMCCEILALPSDTYPVGEPRWIDLKECEVARVPYFAQLENGMIVLPVFSLEEYLISYFQRVERWDSISIPQVRAGTQWDPFCKLPFPVLSHGPLQKYCAFATVAVPNLQVGLVLDPYQPWSKFISYPEMLYYAKNKNDEQLPFNSNLVQCVNTTKWNFKVVTHDEALTVVEADARRIPHIALLEMQLLLFGYPFIEKATVAAREKPVWKRVLSRGDDKFTLIEITVKTSLAQADMDHVAEAVKSWSYLSEYPTTVEVLFSTSGGNRKTASDSSETVIFTEDDRKLFTRSVSYRGVTPLRHKIGFDEPLPTSPRMWKGEPPKWKGDPPTTTAS